MGTINVKQVRAKDSAHKGKVLVFAQDGSPDPKLISLDLIEPALALRLLNPTTELEGWEPDLGSQPMSVPVGNFMADAFDGYLDTAIYTEETIGHAYDLSLPIKLKVRYAMSSDSTDPVHLSLGYNIVGDNFSPLEGYTELPLTLTPLGDTEVHTVEFEIPAHPSVTDSNPIISLRFQRLGSVDASIADFNLLSTVMYQE